MRPSNGLEQQRQNGAWIRGRGLPALIAEKGSQVLRMSTPDTIGGVEQLQQRIKQDPNRIPHVDKLSKLKTKVRAGSEWIRFRR